jgi:hypothetical protein
VEGVFEGEGKMTFDDGTVLEGTWQSGSMVKGKQTRVEDGLLYVGDFKDSLFHGHGMAKSSDQLYEGEWRNGEPCGRGLLKDSLNGIVYEGEMMGGRPHGRGKETNSRKGHVYEGDLRYGMKEGHGRLTYTNGSVYEGQFQNDVPEGRGKFTRANGDTYEGEWRRGKQWGKGRLVSENGTKAHEGHWSDGVLHGEGKEISLSDGTVLREGVWEKGKFTLPPVIAL